MEFIYTLDQLDTVAKQIISESINKVILFHADMGVGKTTLIKRIAGLLGVENATNSPTFSIVNEYKTQTGQLIFHFDLYRIENEEEAYDMGMEEYLESGNWCFIEWPEKISSLYPLEYTEVFIHILSDESRKLTIVNHTK